MLYLRALVYDNNNFHLEVIMICMFANFFFLNEIGKIFIRIRDKIFNDSIQIYNSHEFKVIIC